jgi:NADH-quinone oxidoreductase subunit E
MDNLLQMAMDMILCLIIAAIIGAIIGYLLGKISKCEKDDELRGTPPLNSYEEEAAVPKNKQLGLSSSTASSNTTVQLSDEEKASLSLVNEEIQESSDEKAQAFQKTIEGIEGERPEALPAPVNGIPDDLKEISGIGLKIEEALNELGIFHFGQIAAWTPENVKWIDNYLVFKGRVNRENWIGQAKLLAAGQATEFSTKVQKGKKKY